MTLNALQRVTHAVTGNKKYYLRAQRSPDISFTHLIVDTFKIYHLIGSTNILEINVAIYKGHARRLQLMDVMTNDTSATVTASDFNM